jgi:D-alanyl-D-alanine carboxypeptidase
MKNPARPNSASKSLTAVLVYLLFIMPLPAARAGSSMGFSQTAVDRPAKQETDLPRLREAVQARLNELHKNAEFPGATVGFILADGRYAAVSTGLADLERQTPLKPRDRLLAGSIGKTFFAALALQLVEEGRLSLDRKIAEWLARDPWFQRLPNAKEITVRQLMNHTSGLEEYYPLNNFIEGLRNNPDRVFQPELLLEPLLDRKALFAAGQGWSYADTNYILLGMIIERITKKSLYSEVERRILKPLALTRTIPSNRRRLPEVITGYSMPNSPFGFEGRVILDGKFIINPQFEWAGGGYASTAEDLARWAKALYEGKLFNKKMLAEMLEAVPAKTGRGDKYGLGVQVRESDWGVSYGHSGWFPGYLSNMEYFPEHKVAIAIQFNTDAARKLKKNYRAYVADIARIIIGEPATKKAS